MIAITYHAQQRLDERYPTKKHKYQKIVEKAWRSKEKSNKPIHIKGEDLIYRLFFGYIFVFQIKEDAIVLITLYQHKGFNLTNKYD